jgi:DNA polymerase-3 subunit epsilon
MLQSKFLAMDFETANYSSDSACSIGLVRVENHKIVEKVSHLIKPPSNQFVFTYIHGISWRDVAKERPFGDLWGKIKYLFEDIDFVVAHNISFDKKVLHSCCDSYKVKLPTLDYKCTMKLSRDLWQLRPTKLSDVCSHFKIKLNHHEALSDALGCAQIMIHAEKHIASIAAPALKPVAKKSVLLKSAVTKSAIKKVVPKVAPKKRAPLREVGL